jgi:2-methylisocitrate lyase-like PEP mutase family enzyme
MANAWDIGSAKVLAHLQYQALATTSSGFANTLGRRDGGVTRDEAIAHGAELARATPLPVSADLENGYATSPDDVAATVARAATSGLAGCSIEDWAADARAIYDRGLARERVAAAAEAAHAGPVRLVLTARAENHIRGVDDLDDTIDRLQGYASVGADVVYAPGITSPEQIRQVVDAVDVPVNVLVVPGVPPIAELAELGVARVSVGGAFALAALGALATAARELQERGTYGFCESAAAAVPLRAAFD